METFQFQREIRIKALHKKNLIKAKNIIADSIKDHLIPQGSSVKRPKEDDEAEGSRRSLPKKQIKISIQFSFHYIIL